MTETNRRSFLKRTAALVSGVGLERGKPQLPVSPQTLDPELLLAVGLAVLPLSALKKEGVERVVNDFLKWIDGFEPVAELDHPYLSTADIPYGPPHPQPRWVAQLEALETEAKKRFNGGFAQLSIDQARDLITRQIDQGPEDSFRRRGYTRFPEAAAAGSVAVGLLIYFYRSSKANDLCHQARIGQYLCRGMESGRDAPKPI